MNFTHIAAIQEFIKRRERRQPGYLLRKIFSLFGVTREQMQTEQSKTGHSFAEILGIRTEDLRRNGPVSR